MECPINPLYYSGGDTCTKLDFHPTMDTGERKANATTLTTTRQSPLPQPHFKIGYTGYTPGAAHDKTGHTYAHYTNKLLADHRVGGSRLSRLPGDYAVPLQNQQTLSNENPHETLEPHFLPGYTGFTPGSGIRRSECVGGTYGRTTHIKLAKHYLKGGRLRPIHEYPPEYVAKEEDDKFYCYEHELTRDDLKRQSRVLPGYAGHIPRAVFRHGKNSTQIAEESIAEFQKLLNKNKHI